MASVWTEMTNEQRVSAVHFDFMRHNEMALLAGVIMMGSVRFKSVGTACTDGLDCIYDPDFWRALDRLEARFVVGHENFHKALKHCTNYMDAVKKYPQLSNVAMDYVVNGLLHQADPEWTWMKPPKGVKILLDKKYYNWSFPQVLMDLLQDAEEEEPEDGEGEGEGEGDGDGDGEPKEGVAGGKSKKSKHGKPFDEHQHGRKEFEAQEKQDKEIDAALRQGAILSNANKSRSNSGSGGRLAIENIMERKTNWKQHMLDFVCNVLRGEDVARWSRINGRIFGATNRKVLLPTLYSETVGHIGIFADTSGSMGGTYPLLFGEVAHIMESVKPEKVTLVWWDTQVANVQEFTPEQFGTIRSLLKPAGGGGTEPQCVADYINEKKLKFQCAIWLTDGYIGSEPRGLHFPQLWGVVDNEGFNARTGKTVHINSLG